MARPWNAQNTPADVSQLIEQLERHCLAPDGSYLTKSAYSELHLAREEMSRERLRYLEALAVYGEAIGMIEEYQQAVSAANHGGVRDHQALYPHFRLTCSPQENGTLEEFGLAPDGIEQAKLAGELFDKELKSKNVSIETVRICYSPFSRTTHTAKIVADVLGISFESFQCKAMTELRERFFGSLFELQSHDKYAEIWALDENDPFSAFEGGESVADVVSRLLTALTAMEAEYQGCNILVVSHGDPLQILQAIFDAAEEKSSPEADISSIRQALSHSVLSQHRKFALITAELRQI